MQQFCVTI